MQLFYREEGNGYPLIILHGLYGASDNWLPVAHLLSPFFRVILPDLRNHGHSPHHPLHTYEAMTEDVAALIGNLHLSVKPHLVGHSMGGKVVMSLLLKKPALTARNIVLDIAPQTYPLSEEHQRLFHFIHTADLHRFPSYAALRQHLALCLPSEREQQIILKNITRQKGTFRWRINAEALYRAREEIRSWQETGNCCTQEILFIKGENSPYIPDTETLKKTFPAALLSNIPQAGHWLHTEQPEKLAEIIRTYLSQPVNSRLDET